MIIKLLTFEKIRIRIVHILLFCPDPIEVAFSSEIILVSNEIARSIWNNLVANIEQYYKVHEVHQNTSLFDSRNHIPIKNVCSSLPLTCVRYRFHIPRAAVFASATTIIIATTIANCAINSDLRTANAVVITTTVIVSVATVYSFYRSRDVQKLMPHSTSGVVNDRKCAL